MPGGRACSHDWRVPRVRLRVVWLCACLALLPTLCALTAADQGVPVVMRILLITLEHEVCDKRTHPAQLPAYMPSSTGWRCIEEPRCGLRTQSGNLCSTEAKIGLSIQTPTLARFLAVVWLTEARDEGCWGWCDGWATQMGTFSGNGVLATSVVRALRGSGHRVLVFAGMPPAYAQQLPADTVRERPAPAPSFTLSPRRSTNAGTVPLGWVWGVACDCDGERRAQRIRCVMSVHRICPHCTTFRSRPATSCCLSSCLLLSLPLPRR